MTSPSLRVASESLELTAGIIRGDAAALREMFLLYAPLLRDQARKLSVDAELVEEMVTTVLDDVAVHLQTTAVPPRDLATYLVAALRNRARSWHRKRERRTRVEENAYTRVGDAGQMVVAECHSQYSLGASSPERGEQTTLHAAIASLAERSVQELSATDLHLVMGISRHVPVRELAEQVGVAYATARVRVHRLRARMRTLALEYLTTLADDERHEVERFLRRAGLGVARPIDAEREREEST